LEVVEILEIFGYMIGLVRDCWERGFWGWGGEGGEIEDWNGFFWKWWEIWKFGKYCGEGNIGGG
jgi:hypothetical protein